MKQIIITHLPNVNHGDGNIIRRAKSILFRILIRLFVNLNTEEAFTK